MPEEGLETHELKEQLEESREHAEGHGHKEGMPKWITALSLSTAIIAVFAATASLQSGTLANDALLAKNRAIHATTQAADNWTRFQAQGMKQDLYDADARFSELLGSDPQTRDKAKAFFESASQKATGKKGDAERDACCSEEESEKADQASEGSLHQHHQYARAVTIFQVAIALSAIAALTRKKLVWYVSMMAGVIGVVFFVLGFLPPPKESPGGHENPAAEACDKYAGKACEKEARAAPSGGPSPKEHEH